MALDRPSRGKQAKTYNEESEQEQDNETEDSNKEKGNREGGPSRGGGRTERGPGKGGKSKAAKRKQGEDEEDKLEETDEGTSKKARKTKTTKSASETKTTSIAPSDSIPSLDDYLNSLSQQRSSTTKLSAKELRILNQDIDSEEPVTPSRRAKKQPASSLVPFPSSSMSDWDPAITSPLHDSSISKNPENPTTPTKRKDRTSSASNSKRLHKGNRFGIDETGGVGIRQGGSRDAINGLAGPSRAVEAAQKGFETEDDDALPDIEEFLASTPSKPSKRRKSKDEGESEVEADHEATGGNEEKLFRPTDMEGDDADVGDLCYVKVRTAYWPAKILSHLPAQSWNSYKRRGDRYECDVIASGKRRMKRNDLVVRTDGEFATCQLGLWETYASRAFKHEEQSAMTREATPPTYNAQLNLPEDDYGSLLLRDKLFLIRPHLVKILNDQYQPALELADAFYSSKNLSLQAGDMSQRVVEEILVPELLRWGLRAEWSVGLPEVAVRGLIRPTGSQRYEVLSPEKKEEYIRYVLTQEALIRLIVEQQEEWLNGSRETLLLERLERGDRVPDEYKARWEAENQEDHLYWLANDMLDQLQKQSVREDWLSITEELVEIRAKQRRDRGLPAESGMTELKESGPSSSSIYTNTGRLARGKRGA